MGDKISDLLPSWERGLRAANRAPRTIEDYGKAALQLAAWLEAAGRSTAVDEIDTACLQDFMTDQLERHKPNTAVSAFTRLQQLFRWLELEGEIDRSPMDRMERPHVPPTPPPILDDGALAALLRACRGTSFVQRRDEAIVRLLIDTGMRRSELAGIKVPDLEWKHEVVRVTGKGSKARACPFGVRTAEALDRYERARRKVAHADEPWFWLGKKGRLTGSGIAQMLERRSIAAGVPHIHPHLFRHTQAHVFLVNGGQEGDLMQLMGWSSQEMVHRYGASAANERALVAHRRMGLGNRV